MAVTDKIAGLSDNVEKVFEEAYQREQAAKQPANPPLSNTSTEGSPPTNADDSDTRFKLDLQNTDATPNTNSTSSSQTDANKLGLSPATPDTQTNNTQSPRTDGSQEAGLSVEDLKAIKERYLSTNPDMEPVLAAALKEMERGLNKKFEQVASLKKEAAEQLVYSEKIKNVPQTELLGMVELYNVMANGSPAQKSQIADYLYDLQEALRDQSNNYNQNNSNTPDWRNTPEWQQLQQITYQQQLQHLQTQLENSYKSLEPEFGNQPIPKNQKEHVEEEAQKLGLGVESIPMLWRALYGYDYAKQEGIKKGQQMRQEKQGLGVTPSTSPAPSPIAPSNKPKDLKSSVESVLDAYGVR